jgi:hypothetical protein
MYCYGICGIEEWMNHTLIEVRFLLNSYSNSDGLTVYNMLLVFVETCCNINSQRGHVIQYMSTECFDSSNNDL